MAKTPEKFNTATIEKVFKKEKIKMKFEDFIAALVAEEKAIKDELAAASKEEAKKRYIDYTYPELKDGETIEEFIEGIIEEEEDGYSDLFSCDKLSDDGDKTIELFKIGKKLYEVTVTCDAEWVGDWSMRCNIPTNITAAKIKEIKTFEILKDKSGFYITRK